MNRRKIAFGTYDDVIAEIERLEAGRYEKLGEWSLGQICRHLSYYMRGSLDGFDRRLPWLIRKIMGPPILRRILKGAETKAGAMTIPASVPAPEPDDQPAASEAKELLRRLGEHSGELHPSPLFDRLTADQSRLLHLKHAAHHLGFLVWKDSSS